MLDVAECGASWRVRPRVVGSGDSCTSAEALVFAQGTPRTQTVTPLFLYGGRYTEASLRSNII